MMPGPREIGVNYPCCSAGTRAGPPEDVGGISGYEDFLEAWLDPARSSPDELLLRGRELYLRLPNGVARSKLTNAYFDTTLSTLSTVRSWRIDGSTG